MTEERPSALYRRVQARHRLLVLVGVGGMLAGLAVAAFVAVEVVIRDTAHPVLAIVAGAGILLGVQVLVFTRLSSMLLSLHREREGRR